MIKHIRKSWLSLLILLAILLGLFLAVDLRSVVEAVVSIPPAALAAALLLATADRFAMGYKWRHLLLAAGEKLRVRDAVSAYYQSGLSSRLFPVPIGSELLRAHLIAATGIPAGVVFGSIAMEKLIAWLASSLLGLIGLIYLFAEFQRNTRDVLLLSMFIGVVLGGTALAVVLYRPLHHLGGQIIRGYLPARLFNLLRKLSQAILAYRSRPKTLVVNLLLAIAEQTLQFMKFFVLGRALGITLPLVTFFAIISLTIVVRRVTSYLEGWGLGEISTVVMLALLGIHRDTAVALSFLNYTTTVVASLPGAYLLYRSGLGLQGRISQGVDHTM